MAVSDHSQGSQCVLIDSVPADFYCKRCSLVAKRLTITSCCGESYCHACIADTQQQAKPCPTCGKKTFTTLQQIKYQRRIEGLRVYCSMKRRGCDWSGTLDQLDTHLDPDQDNCQHVDTKCPLHCQQTIPKNEVEQHMAEECVKRDYVCQYCAFKATYEEVVDAHLPECIYSPLQCPNLCGVYCERDAIEDHMRMCRLEEVVCEFSGVGCDGRFIREDQEEHTRQNYQKHLTLTAAATVKTKQLLQQTLQEQEKTLKKKDKVRENQKKDQKKVAELERKLEEQDKKYQEYKQDLEEQKKFQQEQEQKMKVQELEQKLIEQEKALKKLLQEQEKKVTLLQEKLNQTEVTLEKITNFSLKRTFEMTNFSKEREKDNHNDWKSPAMYTHVCGYKFCIGIDANGYRDSRGKGIYVELKAMQGEYDHKLKWPAEASFSFELLNQKGGENVKYTTTAKLSWNKPDSTYIALFFFQRGVTGIKYAFIKHTELEDFLCNDTLYFKFTNITIY